MKSIRSLQSTQKARYFDANVNVNTDDRELLGLEPAMQLGD